MFSGGSMGGLGRPGLRTQGKDDVTSNLTIPIAQYIGAAIIMGFVGVCGFLLAREWLYVVGLVVTELLCVGVIALACWLAYKYVFYPRLPDRSVMVLSALVFFMLELLFLKKVTWYIEANWPVDRALPLDWAIVISILYAGFVYFVRDILWGLKVAMRDWNWQNTLTREKPSEWGPVGPKTVWKPLVTEDVTRRILYTGADGRMYDYGGSSKIAYSKMQGLLQRADEEGLTYAVGADFGLKRVDFTKFLKHLRDAGFVKPGKRGQAGEYVDGTQSIHVIAQLLRIVPESPEDDD